MILSFLPFYTKGILEEENRQNFPPPSAFAISDKVDNKYPSKGNNSSSSKNIDKASPPIDKLGYWEDLRTIRGREWRFVRNILISKIVTYCLMVFVFATIGTAAYASYNEYYSNSEPFLKLVVSLEDFAGENGEQAPLIVEYVREILGRDSNSDRKLLGEPIIDIRCYNCEPIHIDDFIIQSSGVLGEEDNWDNFSTYSRSDYRQLRGGGFGLGGDQNSNRFRNKSMRIKWTGLTALFTQLMDGEKNDEEGDEVFKSIDLVDGPVQDAMERKKNTIPPTFTTSKNTSWGQWSISLRQWIQNHLNFMNREGTRWSIHRRLNDNSNDHSALLSFFEDSICSEIEEAFPTVIESGKHGCRLMYSSSQIKNDSIDDKDIVSSSNMILGNDSDEHGCIASAGYSWCASSGRCHKPWENICDHAIFTDTNDLSITI